MRILLALILFVSVFSIGCDDSPDTTADNRTAGDKVAEAGRKTGDALETAAEKTGEVVGKVTDDTVDLARKTREQGQKTADAAGAVPNDAKAIHNVIAQLAEAAMSPGKFGEIIERLAQPDRARIGDYATKDHPDLNDITGKASAAWNKAFGHNFDVEDETKTFGAGSPITLGGDGKTATVVLAGTTVPFVREAGDWRVNTPDVLNGEGLKNALIKRLDAIGNGTVALPKDEAEAHRLVAQHVIEAMMTTDQPKSPAVPLR
ncbi:MAG: hypothetical protein M3478_05300 [Planctomycetota bacterium]|nr:hypothetical protein [Planctomycetota bacterium]